MKRHAEEFVRHARYARQRAPISTKQPLEAASAFALAGSMMRTSLVRLGSSHLGEPLMLREFCFHETRRHFRIAPDDREALRGERVPKLLRCQNGFGFDVESVDDGL